MAPVSVAAVGPGVLLQREAGIQLWLLQWDLIPSAVTASSACGSFTFLAGRMGGEGKAFGENGKREGR